MFELILATIMALFPIANPFSTAPIFLSITTGDTDAYRNKQATMGVIYMFAILVIFLVAGTLIMKFFGISIPGLRIAGGIMIGKIGMSMLSPKKDMEQTKEEERESTIKKDISFTPLAMPSLSGPGAIAVTIGLTSLVRAWTDYIGIIIGILAVCAICLVVLRASAKVVKFLGVNGMNAMTKIMGFLLLCVGVQFVVNGIIGIFSDPATIKPIIEAIN